MAGRTLVGGGVAVLVLGAVLFTALQTPTGWLLQLDAAVSVTPEEDVVVSRFQFDDFITLDNSTFIDVEVTNQGSVNVSPVTYEINIYDVNNTLLYTYPEQTTWLLPGTFMKTQFKHTPHNAGTYIVQLIATLGGEVVTTSKFLVVQEPPEPTPPPDIVITQKRIQYEFLDAPPPPDLDRSWRVTAPDTIQLEQDSSTTFPITIENTGGANLQSVQLALRSPDNITLTYNPQIMFGIPGGDTQQFVVRATAGRHLVEDQVIRYRVTSREFSSRGRITADIVPTLTLQQLQDQLERLAALLTQARTEIQASRDNGINVTAAANKLDTAEADLDAARTAVDSENIPVARERLEQTRDHIDTTFQKLFEARSQQLVVRAPLVKPVYVLIAFGVIIAALVVGAYYYKKEKAFERPRLLRRLEE